jgi:hypothetical protein
MEHLPDNQSTGKQERTSLRKRVKHSINLFACLEETLTQDARDTLYAESANYTNRRGDIIVPLPQGMEPDEKRPDSVMFLCTIINGMTARTSFTS